MGLFVGLYAWWRGWWFGAGMGLIMLAHEVGHMVAGRARGVNMSWPVFIPFLGAFVTWKGRPRSVTDEAFLAAGGPAFGIAASFAAGVLGAALFVDELIAVAYLGFGLHLLNLVPLLPLDGGRMITGVSRWLAVLLLPLCIYYAFLQDRGGFFLGFAASASAQLLKLNPADLYYQIRPSARLQSGLMYTALLVLTLAGLWWTWPAQGVLPVSFYKHKPLWDPFSFWITLTIAGGYVLYRVGRRLLKPRLTPTGGNASTGE